MQICTQTQMHSSLFLNGPSTSNYAANSRKDAPPTTPGQRFNANSILSLAKSTLQPIPCECIDCNIILNSWNTYTRHVQRVHHGRQTFDPVQAARSQVFRCEWKRCAYRDYPTREELIRHIDQTHLSHVSLPCPIEKCRETFTRHQLFPVHFAEHHKELANITITSTILKRSASPTLLPPPREKSNALTLPLTSDIPTYTIRAPLVNRAKSKLPHGPSLSHSQAFKRQHRHTRLQLSQVAQNSVVPDEESEDVVDFPIDDLCQENLQHEEIVIQPVPETQMDKCLSCPVWIQDFSPSDITDSETIGIKVIESQLPLNT